MLVFMINNFVKRELEKPYLHIKEEIRTFIDTDIERKAFFRHESFSAFYFSRNGYKLTSKREK